jgi:hypothetical protein
MNRVRCTRCRREYFVTRPPAPGSHCGACWGTLRAMPGPPPGDGLDGRRGDVRLRPRQVPDRAARAPYPPPG